VNYEIKQSFLLGRAIQLGLPLRPGLPHTGCFMPAGTPAFVESTGQEVLDKLTAVINDEKLGS
jgi:hypothetical protein